MDAPSLISFLSSEFSVDPSQPLFEQLDSLQVVDLVNSLEKKYKVQISSFEVTVENFDTPERIEKLLQKKLKA